MADRSAGEPPRAPAPPSREPRRHERLRGLMEALALIDRHGCTTYRTGRCWDAGRQRGARYGADAWCDACIARWALDEATR